MYNTQLKSRELLRVKLNSRTPFIPQHLNIEYHTCFEISFLKFLTQDRPTWKNSQILLYLLYIRESSSWWNCIWLKNQIKIDLCFFCQFVSWNAQKGHVLGPNVLVQTVVNSVLIFATLDSTLNAKVFFISMLYKKKWLIKRPIKAPGMHIITGRGALETMDYFSSRDWSWPANSSDFPAIISEGRGHLVVTGRALSAIIYVNWAVSVVLFSVS